MVTIEETQSRQKINSKAIIAVLVLSAFVATFNETILNVALPSIMADMNVSDGTVQWLITAYMIVTSVMVPVTAFLIQSFETKKLFLSALGLLLAGTICAALSKSFPVLLVSRMIQASGTGMMIPIMMNTVLNVAPKEKVGSAMAICVCAISLGPAFGPTAAGLILQHFKWNTLFIMLIPIIIIAMILGAFILVNVSEITKPKMDYLSVILSTVGLASLIYGINNSCAGDVKITILCFVVGITAIGVFANRQNKLSEPMLNLSPLKYPMFVIGVLIVMISMMIMFTMNVMLPTLLQGSLKTTSFVSAIALLPAVLCNGAATSIAGKIYDKHGVKVLVPVGLTIITAFVFILSTVNSSTSIMTIVLVYVCVCIGVGFTMSPAQTFSLNTLPKEYYPHGVAIVNTLQQVSAAIGSSLFMGIMSSVQAKALLEENMLPIDAVAKGFGSASVTAGIIGAIGVVLALMLGRYKAK